MNKTNSVIASREFVLEDKKSGNIEISILKPVRLKSNGDWGCDLIIKDQENIERRTFLGVDAMQALHIAFSILIMEIKNLKRKYKGRLTWLGSKDIELI